jgi:hypothetical protein
MRRMLGKSSRAGTVAAASIACALAFGAPSASAARLDLPDTCAVVPAKLIASALGVKRAPPSTLARVTTTATCSYKGGQITVSVGYTALTNPAPPLKVKKVSGLPHGFYATYKNSTQTQVSFYKGASAATGIYGVVRNFARIPEKKLEAVAKALYAGISAAGGPPAAVGIVSSSP